MTQTELILRARSILNEIGTTSGFWSDTNSLYKYLDSAQREVIDNLLQLQKKMQKVNEFYESESLKILITSKTFNLTTADTYTFSGLSLTDYKWNYDLQLDLNGGGTKYGATYKSIAEMMWQKNNYATAPSLKSPIYAIETSSQLVLYPAPTGSITNGGIFRYYKTPATVTSSQDLLLTSETHEALLYFTVALALEQDKNNTDASRFMKMFYDKLMTLI